MGADDTRLRLLDTAARLFHEQGYHATGVATIQRLAGVHPGSMYHLFPSKERLLGGVLERYLERLRPEITDRAEAATGDPIERVFALMDVYRHGLELTGCKQGCPIGNLALELSDDHADVRALLDRNFANWIGVVAGWIEAGRASFPAGADPRRLAAFVLTVMEGGIVQARARASIEPFDESVAELRAYFDLLRAEARGR